MALLLDYLAQFTTSLSHRSKNSCVHPVLREEVEEAVNSLKAGKSPEESSTQRKDSGTL